MAIGIRNRGQLSARMLPGPPAQDRGLSRNRHPLTDSRTIFLQTHYGMADLYIIGQFAGTRDITAVSIGSQFMHLLTVMLVGLSMGTTVVTARFLGQNKLKSAARSVGSSATVFLAGSMVLAMILFLARGQIPQLMMTPLEAQAGTGSYLAVCFAGIPFIMGYNLISAIYRGMGDSLTPLWFVVTACLANIGLDYFFMGSMNLGPVGAAWGTVLSQGISVVVALLWMKTHPVTVHVSACDFRPGYHVSGCRKQDTGRTDPLSGHGPVHRIWPCDSRNHSIYGTGSHWVV